MAWFASWFDRGVIDSILDGVTLVPRLFGWILMWFQSGRLPSYALMMWMGLLVCVLFAMGLFHF